MFLDRPVSSLPLSPTKRTRSRRCWTSSSPSTSRQRRSWLGCSLFIENALCFTGIEPCSWVTEISLMILELMVFVIEKNTPRHTHFGGNTTAKPYFRPFSCFYFIQPHELPNYARIHCLLLLNEPQKIWGKSQFLGKNDQFCD